MRKKINERKGEEGGTEGMKEGRRYLSEIFLILVEGSEEIPIV